MASIDELERSIAEVKERVRHGRIDRGLPEYPPEDFVPLPLSFVLAERLAPFKAIAVKYFALVADGTFHRVDTSRLAEYKRDAELLAMSVGLNCAWAGSFTVSMIRYMNEINAAIDSGDMDSVDIMNILRIVPLSFSLLRIHEMYEDAYDIHSDVPPEEQNRLIREAVERLRANPDAFQAEYEAAMAHYDTIKHLI